MCGRPHHQSHSTLDLMQSQHDPSASSSSTSPLLRSTSVSSAPEASRFASFGHLQPGWDFSREPKEEQELPDGFTPGNWDVMCGRGKTAFENIGNRRFRLVIAQTLMRYAYADTRDERSELVDSVYTQIRSAGGIFVRLDRQCGKWYRVAMQVAREKIGHALRERLPNSTALRNLDDFRLHEHLQLAQQTVVQSAIAYAAKPKRRRSTSAPTQSSVRRRGDPAPSPAPSNPFALRPLIGTNASLSEVDEASPSVGAEPSMDTQDA